MHGTREPYELVLIAPDMLDMPENHATYPITLCHLTAIGPKK